MKKSNNGFAKMFIITTGVFVLSLIVVEYIFAMIYISDISNKIENNRK
jgi:hypothetical protein